MQGLLKNRYIAFLKLVRLENLVMIAVTMYLLRYFVLQKILFTHQIPLGLNDHLFGFLVLSTVMIAAAGYIINDYFDVKTDLINHPDTVVLDKVIKRRMAIILHVMFTAIGVGLGMLCALKTGYLRLAIFHVAAAVLLWFYSTHFKKQLLVGNIVVSLLTASVSFLPLVYEMGLMQHVHPGFALMHKSAVLQCVKTITIFSIFAFITSMAREMIKDIEDHRGDQETGGHTMPIKLGIPVTKITIFFLLVITILLLMFVIYNTLRVNRVLLSIDVIYIVAALIIPLVILLLMVIKATEPIQYKRASLFLKAIMLMGLGFSFIFYYL